MQILCPYLWKTQTPATTTKKKKKKTEKRDEISIIEDIKDLYCMIIFLQMS